MTLYRIDDYATSPVATDISTTGLPEYPYALAVDALDPETLIMVGDGHWFTSVDSGDNWTDEGEISVNYRGVKRAGDYIVMFGPAIRYSEDGGTTAVDKEGDWSDSLGAMGNVKGLWITL